VRIHRRAIGRDRPAGFQCACAAVGEASALRRFESSTSAILNRFLKESLMPTPIDPAFVTTATDLAGYRIVRNFGMVRGVVVRSRSVFGTIGASLQTLVGGNISLFTELCEKTREEAFELLLQHAAERGANAVVAMRYDANDVMDGVTEVLAYGTAVQVVRAE
jgi:uncharacterized protein YbjQ (UPF0145 family)